jgi:hypothetical protein
MYKTKEAIKKCARNGHITVSTNLPHVGSVPCRQDITVCDIYIVIAQKITIRMLLSLGGAVEPRPCEGLVWNSS